MNIANMTLIDYEILVKNMADRQTDDLVDNDTVNHARILVSELVNSAEKTIKLYTNSFCEKFYLDTNVKEAFTNAKKNNDVSLEIISENDISSNEAYEEYKRIYETIRYKHYSKDIFAKFNSNTVSLNNFMIIDDKGIRYEQEKKENICENIEDIRARATFNRPNDVRPFVDAFNKIISS